MLFITPEVEHSPIIREVEIPKIIQRAEAADGFFVVPLSAGGLDYAQAAEITSNHLSAQTLADWNMHKLAAVDLSPKLAAEIAQRVLVQRLTMIHKVLPPGSPLQVGLFVRRSPPFQPGISLTLDWSARFTEKETMPHVWQDILLPTLDRIARSIRQYAPGRRVEAFGIPTLSAAAAFGCAFLSTSGLNASWRQLTLGQAEQLWSLLEPRLPSGFKLRLVSKTPGARDVAALVSVADNVEPLFASSQVSLAPLRALVHITKPAAYPHRITTPGEATDVAVTVQDGLRLMRREYGNIGTVHLFMAVPAGLAMLIGQLLNTFGAVQTYEHLTVDGSGQYRPAALLKPHN